MKSYDDDADDQSNLSNQVEQKNEDKDSDGEFSLQEKVDKMKKRINNRGKLGKIPKKDKKQTDDFKIDQYSESESQDDDREVKPQKKQKK